MSIGSRLKAIRKDLNLSQKNFGDIFSVHYRTIDNYEKNIREMPQSFMSKLIQMGYCVPWLLTGEGAMKSTDHSLKEAEPFKTYGSIPLMGETAAGPDGYYDDSNIPRIREAEEFVPRPEGIKDPNAYALRINMLNGDSMMPYFKPTDVVIASPMQTVLNNDKTIVKLRDGRVLFKVIRFKDDHIELISANPSYEPINIKTEELVFAHKVVGSWGK
ncbi:MAG: XRE family transcriptional regulator [Candidatus Marinimicrobia bacterium]|nr:XRE family transcriptional regulator [Candidatus Neomarinimicrobiota bacterium]